MKSGGKILFALIAIILALVTIVKIVGYAELIVGVLSFTFGLMAIIWVYRAKNSLSPGSTLRAYTTYFMICLIFILLFSLVLTIERFFIRQEIVSILVYFEYIFLSLAYLTFVLASYKIWSIGQEFGFQAESKEIKRLMSKKKK